MNKFRFLTICLLAMGLLSVACGGGEEARGPAPAPAPVAAAPVGTGAITGVINYANGDQDKEISMMADPICMGAHTEPVYTETIVGDGGRLANVFVYIKSGLSGSYPAPADTVMLNQVGCQYTPHVSGIQVGQTLVIRNSDPTLHNVHAIPAKNEEFNKGQPFPGENFDLKRTFNTPEVMIPFKCDVHPWMSSFLGVLDHPFFAVSGADGSYSIEGLPAGTYTVEAWHETLGTKTMEVTVADEAVAAASFDFTPTAG